MVDPPCTDVSPWTPSEFTSSSCTVCDDVVSYKPGRLGLPASSTEEPHPLEAQLKLQRTSAVGSVYGLILLETECTG